jgi:geranylgeranyl pyrophosphate synthase
MVKKLGKLIIADLNKRSKKGVNLAKHVLQTEKIEDATLDHALEHYIEHWDDSTHPGLFSLACEAAGGDPDNAVLTQAAMTMMAAAFDIHDDVIDKSKVKHKIPTVYGKFGPEIALLLGDAFLIEGFKLFVDSTAMLPKEKEKEAIEIVKRLTFEVGNAHAVEVGLKERKNTFLDDYMKVIEMKAAGIELDMHVGAMFGGGADPEVEVLARLGRILGILGTLREEFIDVFEIEELRQRIAVHDLPLPLLFAMNDHEANRKVLNIISKRKITKNDIAELVDVTLEVEQNIELKEKMRHLVEDALRKIDKLARSRTQNTFRRLSLFMLEDL